MTYEQLADFVQSRMQMSNVYQPVMLMTLLRADGESSTTEIARSILGHDESQVEYYEDVTKNMVGRVFRSHSIVEKVDDGYCLIGYEDLDDEQVEHVVELCEAKLDEYKTKRGKRIWQHRMASRNSASASAFRHASQFELSLSLRSFEDSPRAAYRVHCSPLMQ